MQKTIRKNAVNRELRKIEGGVCAPEGFAANALASGIRDDGGLDLALIFSQRRCATACVYASGVNQGAPVLINKKNLKNGYSRAVLINSGSANAVELDALKFAESVSKMFEPYGVERSETVYASTGYLGRKLSLDCFTRNAKALLNGVESSAEKSLQAAQAIMTTDSYPKQISFAFDIGDYPCKIGAIFKGGSHVAPNMATFIAVITTDVNISTPMLQKALDFETRETFNLLNLDGAPSPNDTVCIMANGRAGNYKIDAEDSEYKKFLFALRAVLTEICRLTAKDGAKALLSCKVVRARSKQISRAVAKAAVNATGVKNALLRGEMETESMLCTVLSACGGVNAFDISIGIRTAEGYLALYENGRTLPCGKETVSRLLASGEIAWIIDLNEGNYESVALSRI